MSSISSEFIAGVESQVKVSGVGPKSFKQHPKFNDSIVIMLNVITHICLKYFITVVNE
jgi:hypothetical protein